MLTLLSDKETHELMTAIQEASDLVEKLTRIIGCAQTVALEIKHTSDTPAPVKPKTTKSHHKTHVSRRKGRRGVAVLNEAKVLEIKRRLAAGGATVSKIARDFGVHSTTINCIKWGKTWKHVDLNQGEPAVVTLQG